MSEIQISDDAIRYLSKKVRLWTGWPDATLRFGTPTHSPVSEVHHLTRTVVVDPEQVILNPNRVLRTVNPFRLRQEAVLTGALLHEAAHARFSRWQPGRYGNPEVMLHSDGTEVSKATLALAAVAEEARIEGLFVRHSLTSVSETRGLEWTLRAMAAHLLPATMLSGDPDQAILDVIVSWFLRAGRETVFHQMMTDFSPAYNAWQRKWVGDFSAFVSQSVSEYCKQQQRPEVASFVLSSMRVLIRNPISTETEAIKQVDYARFILQNLFPETPPDQWPTPSPGAGCGCSETEESGAGQEIEPEAGQANDSPLTQALAEHEQRATEASQGVNAARIDDPERNPESADAQTFSVSGGEGSGGTPGGWRTPTAEERETQKVAERFLRDLLDPTESSKVSLTDQPSAAVDGSALAAWKAGGMVREPRFFLRTRRSSEPAPPARIAILVDISSSMEEMQEPSALLSWALAAAALNLRNFAGRGRQVESCLIHWGDEAEVIQKNGAVLPGIRRVSCDQGTSGMHKALVMVEEELPGFFDTPATPVSRLLVQFTDWKLTRNGAPLATPHVSRALASGMNMLSVMPHSTGFHHTSLPTILKGSPIQRGKSQIVAYHEGDERGEVWKHAAALLTQ